MGKWSIGEIKNAIILGQGKNGRTLYLYDMPWTMLSHLTAEDAEAIAIHLKNRTPIYNKIPPPQYTEGFDIITNKFSQLFGSPKTLSYWYGNSGETDPEKGKHIPNAEEGFWSLWPPVGLVPNEKIVENGREELPKAVQGTALENSKKQRGKYLMSVVPCTLCHNDDLAGGTRISSRWFGTVFSRNLTPDKKTGLGNWSDAEIKRAIQSGVTKNGKMMHWQSMTWDMFANFTEDDLEAIISYLKSIPAIEKNIPEPTKDTAESYTLYPFEAYGTYVE